MIVAQYHFTGNLQDASGNGFDGTAYGPVLGQDLNGSANSAYSFSGSGDYLSFGDNADMGTSDFSVASWFYADQIATFPGNEIIIKGTSVFGNPSRAGYGIRVIEEDGSKNLRWSVGGDNEISTLTYNGIEAQRWYHVVGIREGVETRLYLDGELVKTGSTGQLKNVDTNLELTIGAMNKGSQGVDEFFDGLIDEAYIFNRAINACEVKALYGDMKPCSGDANTDFVAKYHLNEDVLDYSGNDFHGELHGAIPAANVLGQSNQSYEFDGSNDYITAGDVADMGTDNFTISAWFQARSVLSLPGSEIVNKGTSKFGSPSRAGYGIRVYQESGEYHLRFNVGGDDDVISSATYTGVELNKWYHVIGEREGLEMRLYLNGELVAEENTQVLKDTDSNHPLAIGVFDKGEHGLDEFFDGWIDEVYLYNRILNDCEKDELLCTPAGLESISASIFSHTQGSESLVVYPNPGRSQITLTSSLGLGGSVAQIVDLAGRVVLQKQSAPGADQIKIDVSALSPGLFLIQLQKDGTVLNTSFIK